jgi:hypothetical protein
MTTSSSTVEAARASERRWGEATIAVIGAQIAYAELESHGNADDGTGVAALVARGGTAATAVGGAGSGVVVRARSAAIILGTAAPVPHGANAAQRILTAEASMKASRGRPATRPSTARLRSRGIPTSCRCSKRWSGERF